MRVKLLSVSTAAMLMSGTVLAAPTAPEVTTEQSEAQAGLEEVILSPVATVLRERLTNAEGFKSEPRQKLLEDIREYYETRSFEPVWFQDGAPTGQVEALALAMWNARLDALVPADYAMPRLSPPARTDAGEIAEAEFTATLAVIRYATHLAAGRIRPRSLSRHITSEPEKPGIADILQKLSTAKDIKAALKAFEPGHSQYWALKGKLAELLAKADEADQPVIPDGRTLRYGDKSPRVVLLRDRLGLKVEGEQDPELFGRPLQKAVKEFQLQNNLKADGLVGRGTLTALNRDSRKNMISVIAANIERWRWMPRELGDFHVAVNIPEFQVRVNRGGKSVHNTRIVVGKRSHPTPIFSDEMDHIIVNPYWNVPSSILMEEMLPDIMMDPSGYFARHGYQVLVRREGRSSFRPIHPEMIDWFYDIDPNYVRVRQMPGNGNALGQIKFMFPNRHAVYLHDTPSKKLFERSSRAYSHGCVRVKDPLAFADAILVDEPDWDSTRLKQMFGREERKVNLSKHIPVHLTYFTASVGDDGKVATFGDIYGYDRAIRKLAAR